MSLDLSTIQLKDIKYLLAVYRKKSFRQAALICGVSQATISGQISKLERVLNFKLIDRNSRTVDFTETGERIVKQFARINEEFKILSEIVFQEHISSNICTGEFNIGIIPTIAPFFLNKILPRLHSKFNEYKFNIIELTTDRLIEEFKFKNIDLAVAADHPILRDSTIESLSFGKDELVLIINEQNPNLEEGEIDPLKLDNSKIFLLNEGNCLRDHARDICYHNLTEKNVIDTRYGATSLETLKSIVASNLGVSIVPAISINQELPANIKVCPIVGYPTRELCLLFNKESGNSQFYSKFSVELEKIFAVEYAKIKLKDHFYSVEKRVYSNC